MADQPVVLGSVARQCIKEGCGHGTKLFAWWQLEEKKEERSQYPFRGDISNDLNSYI